MAGFIFTLISVDERGWAMLSEMLTDYLRDLDSDEGWAQSDRHDRELAADFEAFTLPSRALALRLADPAVLSLAEQVRIAGNRTVHTRASDQREAWDTLIAVRAVLLALYGGQVPVVPNIDA